MLRPGWGPTVETGRKRGSPKLPQFRATPGLPRSHQVRLWKAHKATGLAVARSRAQQETAEASLIG